MSVQRMLDRTPLCPLCPLRPPLSGPRGDRPPRQRGGGGQGAVAGGPGQNFPCSRRQSSVSQFSAVQDSRLQVTNVWGNRRQEVTFRPLSDCPALALSTARGGVTTAGVPPASDPRGPQPPAQRKLSGADAVGASPASRLSYFTVSGALLGVRACGLRAEMPEGMDVPG